jgi:hypothetical protein
MSEHAILAPSSAAIRRRCPGSVTMRAMYPETEDSIAAREGTAAHWAFAEMLAGRLVDSGQIAGNGVMLTDEMLEAADVYVADVRSTDIDFAGFPPVVEERISIDTINPHCWGTPDTWRFKPYKLIVWDFKYGHRYVDVFENWQMIEYAAGILEKVGITGISDQRTEVEFRLVQPRCYVGGGSIRTWKILASDLRGYFNEARAFEERALQPDAPTVTNPHCGDCSARHACQAAQLAAYDAMERASSTVPFDLPPEAVGVELRYIDRAIEQLQARQTGLAEQALATIKRGQAVPHYVAAQSVGRQRWTRPDAEIIALGQMMGVELSKPKLITPKQAEDKGLDSTLVKAYSEYPLGEVKLKPDDGTTARKVFAK